MQVVKKLAEMSWGIDTQKVKLLKTSKLRHAFCEVCVIGKNRRTPSQVIKRMDLYKQDTKKKKLSHSDLAGGGKITRTLGVSRIVFGLLDD